MTSIITGDIINSRKLKNPELWMTPLKSLLNKVGSQPQSWDIYRGDTFQLEVTQPEMALMIALKIKALVISESGLNTRMAIGIGKKDYQAARITESNGEAFILSGTRYEFLKKEKSSLAVETPWKEINRKLNVVIKLGLIAIDSWSRVSAEYVYFRLANPNLNQSDVAEELGISQSSASARQKRAFYDEIMDMELYYREVISEKLKI